MPALPVQSSKHCLPQSFSNLHLQPLCGYALITDIRPVCTRVSLVCCLGVEACLIQSLNHLIFYPEMQTTCMNDRMASCTTMNRHHHPGAPYDLKAKWIIEMMAGDMQVFGLLGL